MIRINTFSILRMQFNINEIYFNLFNVFPYENAERKNGIFLLLN